MPFTDPNVDDLRRQSKSFAAIARYNAGSDAVAGGSEPVRTTVCAASADFFRVLGVKPFRGRLFSAAEGAVEDEGVVVSHGFWQQSLGGQSDLEDASVRLEDHRFPVVGVLPPGMEFPPNVEVWFPASIYPKNPYRTAHNWSVVARLRDEISRGEARAEIATIAQELKKEYGTQTDAFNFGLAPLRERMVKNVRCLLLVLGGAVVLLLVIACSNVANLLLVRATTRRKEIALRAALGASRWHLLRQFAAETILLILAAAALGVLLALWGVPLMLSLYHGNLPRVGQIGVDSGVLAFTLGISLLLGFVLALVPALRVSSAGLQADLQEAGRSSSGGTASSRVRNLLIISQIAITLMLLIEAFQPTRVE